MPTKAQFSGGKAVDVGVNVCILVAVGVRLGPEVPVGVTVLVAVGVLVAVTIFVADAVAMGVPVDVAVEVAEAVPATVGVLVLVKVGDGGGIVFVFVGWRVSRGRVAVGGIAGPTELSP